MRKVGDNQRSWKRQAESVVEPARHRWQMESTATARQIDAPLRSLRRTLFFFLLLTGAMLAAFVYLLLHAPLKTPLITVGTTNYVWPMPPNSWVKEDVDGLASLHGKVIHWKDSSKAWQSKSACLEDLSTQLRESIELGKRAGVIVLYFNMHGAVNEEGDACLIPPTASCLTSTQWIKVEELGATITSIVPTEVKVLLAFDCVNQQVNWNIAQLNSTFVDRLEQLAESWATKPKHESLVVLSSCSSNQRSWSGADLHSSIFGRQMRLGLAGEADRRSSPDRPGTGNGDGEVSMRELSDYLSITVDDWAQAHRGKSQTPSVTPKSFTDFRVTWALKGGELARQVASVQYSDLAVATPSSTEMEALWRTMDELRAMALYSYDPKSWADLEQKLLWLEQLSNSGAGYAELSSSQIFPSVSKRLNESLERAKANIRSNDAVAKANALQERTETVTVPSYLPSLALQEYLGEIPSQSATALRARVANAAVDNKQTVASIVASLGLAPQASQLNELTFLGLAKKYDCVFTWPDHSVIEELFELRDRCERLAVQGDVRGHRWRRTSLALADSERRKAEDRLILGPGDLQFIESPWNAFRKSLSQIDSSDDSAGAKIDFALRVRDQGFAEVGYLANWICSPEMEFENLAHWNTTDPEKSNAGIVSPFFREELAIQELKRLIIGLHELSEVICKVSVAGVGEWSQLDELVSQVKRDFESLKGLVRDHIERVGRNSADPAKTIRESEALLALPFLRVDERATLRKLFIDKLHEAVKSSSSKPNAAALGLTDQNLTPSRRVDATLEDSSDDSFEAKQTRYTDRLRNWGSHPLGELLLLKDGLSLESMSAFAEPVANDKLRELTAVDIGNARLRRCFQSMQIFGPNRVGDWGESAGVRQTFDAESVGWVEASFAEQFERAMVPLCPIRFETNNALMFRRLAFKDLLHWYANRVTDDFYAEPFSNSIVGNIGESYFERSVKQVLDYATLIPGETDDMAESARATRERVLALGPISRNGIRTSVKLGPPNGEDERIQYEVSIMPTIASSAGRPWKLPIPEGQGSLLVRNANGILKERRLPVAMPIDGDQATYRLTSERPDPNYSNEAVLVYRGHEFRAPISVGQGIVVDFQPNHCDWAEVVLFGQTKRQSSIVFVLDCSWSMGEELPVEAISVKSQSRLDLAKESILRMLTQLAARPDARIGVRLFGHRLGWSRPTDPKTGVAVGKTQVLTQPNYPDPIPNDLVPSRDVEKILPLGRFTAEMVGGVANKLSQIVPWGQSPLYLSIIESFQDFDADDDTTAKSIVVITDGDNFQFNASGRPGGEPVAITSIEEVLRAWNTKKVPLFILGVGVSNAENAAARKNLFDLAERTEGKYYDIENGSDLLRALSEQLSLGTYTVSKLDLKRNNSVPTPVSEAKLNTPVEIKPITSAPYEVSFQSISKTVQFQGGESLELYLNEDGQDIVGKPFDRGSPIAATLVRQGENARITARVHRPSQLKNGFNFPISLQDPDNYFTPRPTQLWIEVTPVASAESPRQTYFFYDANFEPKMPVPLVSWNASNWPANATAAEVRVWAKFGPTPNLQSIQLEQVIRSRQRYAEGIALDGVEGVNLSVTIIANRGDSAGLVLQVTESHSDRSKGVGSIRVGLESEESIVPSRVTRRFEPANSMAVHTFEFDAMSAQAFQESSQSRIAIQSRAAVQLGAWQLQSGQPIHVEVTAVPETLPQPNLPTAILSR